MKCGRFVLKVLLRHSRCDGRDIRDVRTERRIDARIVERNMSVHADAEYDRVESAVRLQESFRARTLRYGIRHSVEQKDFAEARLLQKMLSEEIRHRAVRVLRKPAPLVHTKERCLRQIELPGSNECIDRVENGIGRGSGRDAEQGVGLFPNDLGKFKGDMAPKRRIIGKVQHSYLQLSDGRFALDA